MPADLQRLKTEFQTDPVAVGYGAWASVADDIRVQALFHDDTKRPKSSAVVVAALDVVNCIVDTEFSGLSQVQLLRLFVLLAPGSVDLTSVSVRNCLRDIFPSTGGALTRAALTALYNAQKKTISRAEELGLGCTVEDVTAARLA